MHRIPREGTRARSVYDQLVRDYNLEGWKEPGPPPRGHGTTRFRDAKAAYDNTHPAYPPIASGWPKGGRYHSGMTVAKTLLRFAKRIAVGEYELREEYRPHNTQPLYAEVKKEDIRKMADGYPLQQLVEEDEKLIKEIDDLQAKLDGLGQKRDELKERILGEFTKKVNEMRPGHFLLLKKAIDARYTQVLAASLRTTGTL